MRKILYPSLLLAWLTPLLSPARADVLFVPSTGSDTVKRVGSSGVITDPITGLLNPTAVVFDVDGNAYVSDSGNGRVLQYPVGGGGPVIMASGLNNPSGLAVDASGNVYAAIAGASEVIKITAPTVFAPFGVGYPAAANPQGVALDANGNLYVANKAINSISKITALGVVSSYSDSGAPGNDDILEPIGLAFDSTGTLYATDTRNFGRLVIVPDGNKKLTKLADNLGDVQGVAIDAAGNAYVTLGATVALGATDQIKKITPGKVVSTFVSGITGLGLLTVRSATTTVVAEKTGTAAGTGNAQYISFGFPATNDNGVTAFRGNLVTGTGAVPVVASSNSGIWVQAADGTEELVAREGFANVGTPFYFSAFSDPVLNNNDIVGFRATLKSGINGAASGNLVTLFSGTPSALSVVARQGIAQDGNIPSLVGAPTGVPIGVKFTKFTSYGLADNDKMIFVASIAGPSVTTANNSGIWVQDSDGALLLVRRKGDKVSIDGGVTTKTLTSFFILKAAPLVPGQTRSFNDAGDLSYLAKFSDGTQAILRVTFP